MKILSSAGHMLCPVFQIMKPWILAAYTILFGPALLLIVCWLATFLQ